MNEGEKQFSFTRAAPSTSGRAKNQIPISSYQLSVKLHEHHNPQYGLQWKDVTDRIKNNVRDLICGNRFRSWPFYNQNRSR
jgi:hypothetical protein